MSATPRAFAFGNLNGTAKLTLLKAPGGRRHILRTIIFHNSLGGVAHNLSVFFNRDSVSRRLAFVQVSNGETFLIEEGWVLEPTDSVEAMLDSVGTTVNFAIFGVDEGV
jgi:hypothetical protein